MVDKHKHIYNTPVFMSVWFPSGAILYVEDKIFGIMIRPIKTKYWGVSS